MVAELRRFGDWQTDRHNHRFIEQAMITGIHALIYTKDAADVRAFFRDVLGFSSVNAGEDWLIFGLYQPKHPTAIETR